MGPTQFTTSLHFAKTARGRIAVDDQLRVLVHSTRPEEHGPTTPGQVSFHILSCRQYSAGRHAECQSQAF